ncbi:unnamed protein product [Adineta steineri]|uniref:Uncharacterized protein n=1 Tax=Adineta steineri TaxID=433720 RepID=A0A818PD35_9BILA|nr:unnamed protein product [Adineta steineri]CAF3622468.1 unnamed protein product [Adineta steineri]
MRAYYIFLSISMLLVSIQYSNCAPRKIRSLDNDKFNSIVENFVDNLKSFIHDDNTINDNNELSEQRQKVIDALDIISKSKESNSDSDEQENLDKQEIVSNYIDIDHHNVPENSEEN